MKQCKIYYGTKIHSLKNKNKKNTTTIAYNLNINNKQTKLSYQITIFRLKKVLSGEEEELLKKQQLLNHKIKLFQDLCFINSCKIDSTFLIKLFIV
jgi:hypothetical protein